MRDPADRQSAVDAIIAFARAELPDCEVLDDAVESPVHDKLGQSRIPAAATAAQHRPGCFAGSRDRYAVRDARRRRRLAAAAPA